MCGHGMEAGRGDSLHPSPSAKRTLDYVDYVGICFEGEAQGVRFK